MDINKNGDSKYQLLLLFQIKIIMFGITYILYSCTARGAHWGTIPYAGGGARVAPIHYGIMPMNYGIIPILPSDPEILVFVW